jgi:hypothetical protein
MDTSLRDSLEATDWQEFDELLLEVPTGILSHEPTRADPGADYVWPEVSGDVTPTYLHGGVVVTVAAGYAWFLLAFWAAFWGFGYMMFTIFMRMAFAYVSRWRDRAAKNTSTGSSP